MSWSPRARWGGALALYVGLTLAYARTLLPEITTALPNDIGDPGLNAWILWWNSRAIPLTETWWNAPIFFPVEGAFALSETLLSLWPLSSPLQWAGANAVLTYNVMFLLSFPAAALSAHLLARHLTGRHDAGLIAGLAFGFAPYRAAQMPHIQALWSCWMPLALFGLHRYLETKSPRYLVLFGVAWLMNALSTGYYLFFFAVLAAIWMLWFVREIGDWVAIGTATVLASVPLVPLLFGYQHYQSTFGVTRGIDEIRFFGADLTSIWATTPYVWPSRWTLPPAPEGELYPGAIVLALVVLGALMAWRRRATAFYAVAAVAMFAFALGPSVKILGDVVWPQAPYLWLMELPGGQALRVPARFGMLVALCLSVAAGIAFVQLTPRPGTRRRLAIVIPILLGIACEGFVAKMEVARVPPPLQLGSLAQGAAVLELPGRNDFDDTAAMIRATEGGWPLVNGFSGYWPPHYRPFREGTRRLDNGVVEVLRQFATLLVFVNSDDGRNDMFREMVATIPGIERVQTRRDGTLFRLRQRAAPPFTDTQIPVAELSATVDAGNARTMLDGNLTTRWQTPGPQRSGNEVTITLDRQAVVSRVELTLGSARDQYPRRLRITVSDDDGASTVAYDGWAMGPAVRAALMDRQRMPIVLDLSPQVRGRRVTMTLVEDIDDYPWSIAELAVFGR